MHACGGSARTNERFGLKKSKIQVRSYLQTDFLAFFGFARANNIQIVTFSGRSTKVPTFVSYLRRYIEYGQGGHWLGTALIFNGHRAEIFESANPVT